MAKFTGLKTTSILMLVVSAIASFVIGLNDTFATETDAWTYRSVTLQDTAPAINQVLNAYINQIFKIVNDDIRLAAGSGRPLTAIPDAFVERRLANRYFNLVLADNNPTQVFSVFEYCIDHNNCKNFPNFERILVKPTESVYGTSHYSEVPSLVLASQVNLCGVRMGTDKITHIFLTGFRFYNGLMMEKGPELDDQQFLEEVRKLSIAIEDHTLGKALTEVISQADVDANVAGAKFFLDQFRHARRKINGELRPKPANICDYVSPRFDEAQNPNIFTNIVQRPKLMHEISKRDIDNSNYLKLPAPEQDRIRRELLERKYEGMYNYSKVAIALKNSVEFAMSYMGNRLMRRSIDVYTTSTKAHIAQQSPQFIHENK